MISVETKVFIENNKDLIENNNWQQVWDNYIDYAAKLLFYEDSYYDELHNLLFIAGILSPEQSFKDRRDSVRRNLIDKLLNSAAQKKINRITKQAMLGCWPTILGLSQDEVLKIIDEESTKYGYKIYGNYIIYEG